MTTYKAIQDVHERKTLSINSVLTQRVIKAGEEIEVEEIKTVGQNEYLKLVGGGWVISKFGNSPNSLIPALSKASAPEAPDPEDSEDSEDPEDSEATDDPAPEAPEAKPVTAKRKMKKNKEK